MKLEFYKQISVEASTTKCLQNPFKWSWTVSWRWSGRRTQWS